MEQDQELGGGIGVIFVPAKSFIRSPVSIPTPGSRWMSSVPGGRNSGLVRLVLPMSPCPKGALALVLDGENGTSLMPSR